MSSVVATADRDGPAAGRPLLVGIVLAALTEAFAGTVLSLGRVDLIGDTHATPDEFAWLDIGYVVMKFIGFLVAPWWLARFGPRHVALTASLVMGAACGLAAATTQLDLLIALRFVQGLCGGALLVAGQAVLFLHYPRAQQPLLQALFATGAVVAPAMLAPALQGWLIDSQSWAWIFFGIVPVALAAAGLLLIADEPAPPPVTRHPFDWAGFALIAVALSCLTYVFSQGSRWDWFEAPRIVWLTVVAVASLSAFVYQQRRAGDGALLDLSVFRSEDFNFAFAVSFVAGAALFVSAFLIPAFAVSVLGFTAADAGLLLLPSGVLFVASLLVAAFLMQRRGLPPVATVPFGILMIMAAMWMLSGSTRDSGADDMMPAILLRGFGLGFLFLSITLIAFGTLDARNLASGIGLFNTGRQLGGLIGVAGLQTLIEHQAAGHASVLGANLSAGGPAVADRLSAITAMLVARGMDAAAAGKGAISLLGRAVAGQSTVLAFDMAFAAVALLFVAAAPVLVCIKVVLAKHAKARAGGTRRLRMEVSTHTQPSP
jgi:DHA2 family multidrug resistance protein